MHTSNLAFGIALLSAACGPTPPDVPDASPDATLPDAPADATGGAGGGDAGAAGSGDSGGAGGLDSAAGSLDDGSADAVADTTDHTTDDAAEDTSDGTGGSGGAAGASDAGGDVDDAATPDDAAPFCGNALRDPLTEECDDGTVSTPPDSCSADCRVTDVLPLPGVAIDGGPYPSSRYLGEGRHPVAAGDAGFAVAFIEPGPLPPVIALTTFSPIGAPTGSSRAFGTGSTAVLASNPVLAALPGGLFAAAWTDLDGDGDELGVALRVVDPSVAPSGAPAHANVTTDFSQYDPDVVWTGSELVVAWVDGAAASTGPDVKCRRFSTSLAPLSGEPDFAPPTGRTAVTDRNRSPLIERTIGNRSWECVFGNRVQHVLAHTVPDATKPMHSVFNVGRSEVLGLVDEAWAMRGAHVPGDPGAFVVPMGRQVGTAGETAVRIVVRPGTNHVITAYPVAP